MSDSKEDSKRAQWIAKMMSKENLLWVDKKDGEDLISLIYRLWELYDNDFNLSISDICTMLLCDRKWVVDHVLDNVKHIFLNDFIRAAMLGEREEYTPLKDYYYISRKDFYRWLNEHTIAERQTIRIDIGEYSTNPVELKRVLVSYDYALAECKTNIERGLVNIEYNKVISDNLNSLGRKLYSLKCDPQNRGIKSGTEFTLISSELPKKFTSLKEIKGGSAANKLTNNELIYRHLFKMGAIRYTIQVDNINNKTGYSTLVRYDSCYANCPQGIYGIVIPYNKYVEAINEVYL